jgi:acyl transferase domain-containing protein
MQGTTDIAPWSGFEVAIIGMAGRFPGAKNTTKFWQNLRDGVESIAFFTEQELVAAGVDPALLRNPSYVKARGVLEDIEWFDAAFFGVTPREAAIMDPQHRLFLECAWEALEHAGYDPAAYPGAIGVYAGANMSHYALGLLVNPEVIMSVGTMPLVLGNDKDYLCTRVSYKLNLEGPSLAVQTSCSTSLVAVHLACQGLLSGACDMALAGGVSISVPHKGGYVYQQGGIYAPDGHCRAFDARAEGTVSGSGLGLVVLKRLADALAEGDNILAIIKGSAINNDGGSKAGYTAPRVQGQAQVIRAALQMAEVDPATITYVEAHGTGTTLGDPIEVTALTQAFRSSTEASGFCALGSVKTNIGHLDAAAGIAGLIKTVLALQHRALPPSLHFHQANPQIDFAHSPFYVNAMLSEWNTDGGPRRAGVSSFGIGGTNAHVILEEAPLPEASGPARARQLLLLSARTPAALEIATTQLIEHCTRHPDLNLADVAYTLQIGRRAFDHRRMLVCHDLADAVRALETRQPARVHTAVREAQERPVVFLFPGQGAQHVHMGAELYHSEPLFREHVEHCASLLAHHLGLDLRDVLYPDAGYPIETARQLAQTRLTQPALFVIEYALARLWMAWGVRPQAMLGHSIGEYVAACLAGVLGLEDALALVATRGRLMQQLPSGAMLAVALSEQDVQPFLSPVLSLAATNGPSACVVAGPTSAVAVLEQRLRQRDVPCRRLQTSHAFHSVMMDPVIRPFMDQINTLALQSPAIRYVSNVTGTWITTAEATAASYWARHLRQTVRFSEGLHTVLQDPECLLLEVGPGQTLSTLARRHLAHGAGHRVLASFPGGQERGSEGTSILHTLGQLWLAGVEIDWAGFSARERRRRLPLPSYPFERQRYWLDSLALASDGAPLPSAGQTKADIGDWFYLPSWKRSMPPGARTAGAHEDAGACWIVFADTCGLGEQIARRLRQQGYDAATVVAGEHFAELSTGTYCVRPDSRDDYEALLQALHNLGKTPTRIVHCWSVTGSGHEHAGWEGFERAQKAGFDSLLLLAQTLGERPDTVRRRVMVVSNNLYDVTGTEGLCPEKATVRGCCQVLPREYPDLTCRSVDVVLGATGTWSAETLVDQIMAELSADVDDAVVAYRGPHRWLQTFEPFRLDGASGRPVLLRDRGVYLITGGLGGVGLLMAEYLARSVQARLVLIGRTGLPPREQWARLLASSDGRSGQERVPLQVAGREKRIILELEAEVDGINRVEKQTVADLHIRSIQDYDGLEESLNRLCSKYILSFFKENITGLNSKKDYEKNGLKKDLGIIPQFGRFYEMMLSILQKDKFISIDGGKIKFLNEDNDVDDELKADMERKYPEFKGLLRLLEYCVRQYGPALRGDLDAISVLYPNGSGELLREAAKHTVEHDTRRIYLLLLKEILAKIMCSASPAKVRILEVGGGNGTLTKAIVPSLEREQVEYYFTDIGTSFVIRAEQEALKQGLDFMRFGTLDITRNPEDQGYTKQSFDIILGLDVVHATKNIEETVDNLQSLLAPNGMLFLVETVKTQRWIDMIWGLAEGWWSFEDHHIRRDSPILSLDTWETVLCQRDFKSVRAFPQDVARRAEADYGLIIAQQHAEAGSRQGSDRVTVIPEPAEPHVQGTIRQVQRLEQLGAEVLAISADVANPQSMQAVLRQARERFGAVHGVIHAAAVAGGGVMHLTTPQMARSEFAPKIGGVLVLEALCAQEPVDFLALCSSLSSLMGGVGQVSYCAANAFLDAFAHANTSKHKTYTVAINWDRWRDVGMAVAVEARHRTMRGDDGDLQGMTPDQGVEALHRILSQRALPQVVVSTQDFKTYLARARAATASQGMQTLARVRRAKTVHSRPALGQVYVAPRDEREHRVADIWQEVFGIEPVGIYDDFFELGGESLLALQLLNRLRSAFQVEVSLRRFFAAPTVAGLTAELAQARDSHPATSPPALVPLSREAHRRTRPV